MTPRYEAEHAHFNAVLKATQAGFDPDVEGWWPDAAADFFNDRRLILSGDTEHPGQFRVTPADWWDDDSFHRHMGYTATVPPCPACDGDGGRRGVGICPVCDGTGQAPVDHDTEGT